jgi:hypothetical protein
MPRQPTREAAWEDLREVLDDEVRRLPNKFRAPLVLCYLQDLTREEAAARLGWSPGAVKGMLERGREVLRSRLARRGVALSAGALAVALSRDALSAAVPAVLMDSTARAAVAFAARDAAAAGSAAVLAEGVLQSMRMTRLKVWLAVVLVLGVALTGAGVAAYGMRPAEDPTRAKGPDPPPDAVGQADQLKRLAEARRDASRRAYEGYRDRFEAGVEREEVVHLWSRRWLQAQLDLSVTKAERDAAQAAYQDRLRKTDELARARLALGNAPEGDPDRMTDRFGKPKFENEGGYFDATWKAYENCEATEEQVCLASIRWLMHQHRARRIVKGIDAKAELQAHLDRIKKVEQIAEARHEAGKTTDLESKTAMFFRLQAEEWLGQGKSFEEKGEDPGASSK